MFGSIDPTEITPAHALLRRHDIISGNFQTWITIPVSNLIHTRRTDVKQGKDGTKTEADIRGNLSLIDGAVNSANSVITFM